MNLSKQGDLYVLSCHPWESDIPKHYGLKYNSIVKGKWATKDHISAVHLREYAEPGLSQQLDRIRTLLNQSVMNSTSVDGPEFSAPDGLSYMPFQKGGINYAVNHLLQDKGVLVADEMGLGKTIQAIGIINERKPHSVLIVCPASLKNNWAKELNRWLSTPYEVSIPAARQKFEIANRSVTIINYEMIPAIKGYLAQCQFGMVVADEAQYIKNPRSQRGSAFRKVRKVQVIKGDYRVALTGTPMPNQVSEIHNVLNWIMPGTFGTRWNFEQNYCEIEETKFGRRIRGGKNLDELGRRMRALVMVRRLKMDVLKDLPPKRRAVLEIPSDGHDDVIQDEIVSYERLQDLKTALEKEREVENTQSHRDRLAKLQEEVKVAFHELARMRLSVARAKLPLVIELLKDSVANGQKVLVFAHHREILNKLAETFGDAAVTITGATNKNHRQGIVDRFQTDDSIRVAVLSYKAAGVGLTLTAAEQVDFAEMMWVPDDLSQAEDRAHRHGQTNSVLVRHLVLENSLDARMAKRCVEKQELSERVLNI